MGNMGGSVGNVGGGRAVGSKLLASVQTRTPGNYVAVYNATDGSGTDPIITLLDLTVVASSSTSTVGLVWNIMGEPADWNCGFIVKKNIDGAGANILSPSTDGSSGQSYINPFTYETSFSNTPQAMTVGFLDTSPNAGVSVVYSLCFRSLNSASLNLNLNHTVAGTQLGMSNGTATEYFI